MPEISQFIVIVVGNGEMERRRNAAGSLKTTIAKVNVCAQLLEKALQNNDREGINDAKGQLLNEARDVLSEWLDAQFGSAVNDHSVFDNLAKAYESEFLSDMARLNVLPADVVTRVSEYVPEIVAYVEKIIENGYAYTTNDGSVYFDTKAFESNPKHFYAKLVPEAYGDSESLEKNMREGEGELSMTADKLMQKRNPSDLTLLEVQSIGRRTVFWESQWRDKVEAYYDNPQWVNYFIHCGTLRIAGMKMSKSLKNFITIREALQTYTSRQASISAFLCITGLMFWITEHPFVKLRASASYLILFSTATMERAMQFEKISNEFFLLVKDLLRKHYKPDSPQGYVKYNSRELQIMEEFSAIKKDVHDALCDSMDTRTVIEKLRDLIGIGNAYVNEKEKEGVAPNCLLLRNIAAYMTDLFAMFGVIPKSGEIGFPIEREAGVGSEEMLMPYLNALASFREKVRNIAKDNKVTAILEECDRLRDDVLPELGVRLEDRTQETVVKLCDRDILLREREQKRAIEAARREEKERKAAEKAEKEALKRIPPQEMFCRGDEAAKYSKWDENGIPTHTADGEEISKKQRKKLEKLWETQQKNYQQAVGSGN
ncbi:cysteine--tRNA ligase [Ostertagia ostertagi]